MLDPQRLLEQLLGGNPSNRPGTSPDLLKGAALGGLAGLLLGSKGGRKLGKSVVKLGGMAALGSLAWKAYNDWKASSEGTGAGREIPHQAEGTTFLPAAQPERDTLSRTLLRAMIAAAKADGHLDAEEQRRIFAKIGELDLDAEEKAFLMDELRAPLDIDAVVRGATSPEVAAEIYTISRLAIDPDHNAEKAYLAMLASRLALPDDLVARLEREIGNLPR